jgi:starvation-inducible DNA-binding protein
MTITSPLSPESQKITGEALQSALVDLIGLAQMAKQAHWNVVGPLFKSVHEHLDEVVDTARTFSDQVAERAVAIGVNPDGNPATVAAETAVSKLTVAWLSTDDVVAAVVEALDALSARFRERVSATEETDPVSQDLLIEITEAIEEARWMFQAQTL